MRRTNLNALAVRRPKRSLSARGAAKQTFGSIAFTFAVTLLCFGGYMIEDEFTDPITAQPTALFTAAVTLATGAIVLGYLVRPRKNRWHNGVHHVVRDKVTPISVGRMCWIARRATVDHSEQRRDLPFQRGYVDPARIRWRR
jgi:hypothetical protein